MWLVRSGFDCIQIPIWPNSSSDRGVTRQIAIWPTLWSDRALTSQIAIWLISDFDCNIYNTYDKILLEGDFNAEEKVTECVDFLDLYNLPDFVEDKTYFKSIKRPTRIDIFLINCRYSFEHTKAISAGISDHRKMIITETKTTFLKAKPREIIYRSYKTFDRVTFKKDLKNEICLHTDNNNKYLPFENAFLKVLDMHAPIKKKIVGANDAHYMTMALRKAIATRSRLENFISPKRHARK